MRWVADRVREIDETARLARLGAKLGKDDAVALSTAGFALAYVAHDTEIGAALIDRGLALNPNLAWAWLYSGYVSLWLGNPDLAIEHFGRAMRLNPLDPLITDVQAATAHAHFVAGRYDEAASWAGLALDLRNALQIHVAAHALGGRLEDAKRACARLRQLDPALHISNLRDGLGPYRPADRARLEEGLRKAGLPE